MKKFYVYFLRRPDKEDPFEPGQGCPFYVGKGKNGRHSEHRRQAVRLLHESGRKVYKIAIIHKLWKLGLDFQEDIILTGLSEQEAFDYEKEAIAAYHAIDLANMTKGGEGVTGLIHSEETKKRMSKSHKGCVASKETREKLSIALKGRIKSPEECLKISKANKGRILSEELKKKYSEVQKARYKEKPVSEKTKEKLRILNTGENNPMFGKDFSKEHREKIRQHHLGGKHSQESRIKRSLALKDHFVSEETRRKISENSKKLRHTEETKRKISFTFQLRRWDKILNQFLGDLI